MIKTWHFRGFALYLTLGIPLAASCAREANTLDGADDTGGSSTGTAGKASPTAGTLGKPGPSAFGGTASTGGVAEHARVFSGGNRFQSCYVKRVVVAPHLVSQPFCS